MDQARIPAWQAAALTALSFLALTSVGASLAAHGLAGTVAGELLCVAAPTLAFIAARRLPASALGLGRVPAAATVGGALFGVGAFWLVAVALEAWLERVWPTPPALREAMRRLVIPAAGARPLALDLAALALAPAVAEELLFRGVLYGAARARLGAAGAVIVTALAFGLYHGSIHRFVPAALGGLFLGVARAASGSLWPALAFHAANNAAVIVALHLGWETPPASAGALAAAFAATCAGCALLGWRRRRE